MTEPVTLGKAAKQVLNSGLLAYKTHAHPVHAEGSFPGPVSWKRAGIFAKLFLETQNGSVPPTVWFLGYFLLSDSAR